LPIRFPHPGDPGDAGWHMDACYLPAGETGHWLNIFSRGISAACRVSSPNRR